MEAPARPLARWRVFPVLALGTVMATLDISVVNVALPTVARSFRAPLTTSEWVVLAYVLTLTALLLVTGRVADAVGRRRMYASGLAFFTAASLACAAAPGIGALIATRVLQGIGAAMMSATSLALLTASFPEAERGRAIGAFGAAVGVGLALGPPLGGLVVEHVSWRWIFALHLPLGLATLAMVRSRLPADPDPPRAPRLDGVAIPASTLALVAMMLALSRGPVDGWRSVPVLALIATSLVLAVVFVARDRRASEPLLPLDLLGGPLGRALLLTLTAQALSIAVGLHMPLYLEDVLGMGPGASGRWLALLPLTALLLAPPAGRWSDRSGSRAPVTIGLFVLAIGLGVLAGLGAAPPRFQLAAALILVGTGLGMFSVANSSALMGSVPSERLGTAGGLQATARNLGLSSGSALIVALVASRYTAHGGGPRLVSGALSARPARSSGACDPRRLRAARGARRGRRRVCLENRAEPAKRLRDLPVGGWPVDRANCRTRSTPLPFMVKNEFTWRPRRTRSQSVTSNVIAWAVGNGSCGVQRQAVGSGSR